MRIPWHTPIVPRVKFPWIKFYTVTVYNKDAEDIREQWAGCGGCVPAVNGICVP